MSKFKSNRISVYHKQDDSWYGKIYSQEASKVDESEVNALVDACKAHTRKGCLAEGPQVIHLPSGFYMQSGAGYNFCTGERDIGYYSLSPETVDMIRNFDRFFLWRRLSRLLTRKWRSLIWDIQYGWFSHLKLLKKDIQRFDLEVPAAPEPIRRYYPIYIRFWRWLWNRFMYYFVDGRLFSTEPVPCRGDYDRPAAQEESSDDEKESSEKSSPTTTTALAFAIAALVVSLSGCFSAHPFLEDTGNVKIWEDIESSACPFCKKQPRFRSTVRYSHDNLQPHEYFDVFHFCQTTDSVFHPHFWYFNKPPQESPKSLDSGRNAA